ncbi:MAG TPA: hypothetical protein VGH24_04355 [Solirubrobacteraceae bacterium]
MNKNQLQEETRVRVRMVPVPVLAALLLVIAAVISIVGLHTTVDELTLDLIVANKRFPVDLIGSVINAAGLIALAVVLSFLWRATKARNPGFSVAMRSIAIAGAVLAAASGIVYQTMISIAANNFTSTGQQTYREAHDLTSSTTLLVLPLVGQAAELLLAVAIVLISLNAMRVGLLPKVMGYLGIFVGILFLFPIGSPVPVIQAGWLCALAYLFSWRWPSGLPPAWTKGESVPWPSSQALRQQQPARPARGGRGKPAPTPAPEVAVTPAAGSTRATTSKRKRKRRR